MRRMTYFVMALALVLGFTQCKKEQPANQTAAETVHITLNVENGSKHIVTPGPDIATVSFQDGDVIYVGNGSTYIGQLTYSFDNKVFSGDIGSPVDGSNLYFYYVGVTPSVPSQELTPNETEYVTAGIQNQQTKLPVLSFSYVTYRTGIYSYSCLLENKCGLVKFVLSKEIPTDKEIKIKAMHCDASINFATPGINVVSSTKELTLYAESTTVRWAVLLPQEEVISPEVTIEGYTASIVSIPEITENMYYNDPSVSISILVEPTF